MYPWSIEFEGRLEENTLESKSLRDNPLRDPYQRPLWVYAHYRTRPDRERRGIAGKSSGGYGAMVTPMLRPDLWGGLATHAGDALFEVCYLPEFRVCART